MATKSFTTEFKFGRRNAQNLISAIENSKKVDHKINQKVSEVTDQESIDSIMESFFKRK
ncbi:MAG TPA: hypothetical protein GXZ58_03525 [Bacilli bacterium]|nr:hypothetical protein [Bacilli bacterium]